MTKAQVPMTDAFGTGSYTGEGSLKAVIGIDTGTQPIRPLPAGNGGVNIRNAKRTTYGPAAPNIPTNADPRIIK